MRLHKYVNEHGWIKLDFLLRKKSLKLVYKGRSVFVYPT